MGGQLGGPNGITWTPRMYAVMGTLKYSLLAQDAHKIDKPALIPVMAYSPEDALKRVKSVMPDGIVLFEENRS